MFVGLVESAAVPVRYVLLVDPLEHFPATVVAPVVLRSGELAVFVVFQMGTAPYVRGFDNFATVLGRRIVR